MQPRVLGKVAVITGGASGMGRAAATLLAKEGAAVVIGDANREKGQSVADAIRDQGGAASYVFVDVLDGASVRNLAQQAVARHGRIDILYHTAIDTKFVNEQDRRLTELPEETWSRMIDLVLGGTYRCCKYVGQQMIRQKAGSIVLTSTADARIGIAGFDSYTAAKGGVISLTRSLATGLAAAGIRVNPICPGFVATEPQREWLDRPGARAAIEQMHLMPVADAEDIAPMVLYLASDESRFVTGAIFDIDGGYTAFKTKMDLTALVAPDAQ